MFFEDKEKDLIIKILLVVLLLTTFLQGEQISPDKVDWQSFIPDSLRTSTFKLQQSDTLRIDKELFYIGILSYDKDRLKAVIVARPVGSAYIVFLNTLNTEGGRYRRLLRFKTFDLTGDKRPELIAISQVIDASGGKFNTLLIWGYKEKRFQLIHKSDDYLLEGALVDFTVEDLNKDNLGEIYIGILNSHSGFLSPYIFGYSPDVDDFLQIWPSKDTSYGEFGCVLFYDYDKDGYKEVIVSQLINIGSGDHSPPSRLFFREFQAFRWREQELYSVADLVSISRNHEYIFNQLLTGDRRDYFVPLNISNQFIDIKDIEDIFHLLPRDAILADAAWFCHNPPPSEVYRLADTLLTDRYPPYCPILKLSSNEIGIAYFLHDRGIKDIPLIDDKANQYPNGYYLFMQFFRRRGGFWEMVWESPQIAKGTDIPDMYFYRVSMEGTKIEITFRNLDGKMKTFSVVYPLAPLKDKS